MAVLIVICKIVEIVLSVVSLGMLLRVLLPFFMDVENSRFFALVFLVTECFIVPVRAVMFRLNVGQDSPLDVPFFVTYLLIAILQGLLPIV